MRHSFADHNSSKKTDYQYLPWPFSHKEESSSDKMVRETLALLGSLTPPCRKRSSDPAGSAKTETLHRPQSACSREANKNETSVVENSRKDDRHSGMQSSCRNDMASTCDTPGYSSLQPTPALYEQESTLPLLPGEMMGRLKKETISPGNMDAPMLSWMRNLRLRLDRNRTHGISSRLSIQPTREVSVAQRNFHRLSSSAVFPNMGLSRRKGM